MPTGAPEANRRRAALGYALLAVAAAALAGVGVVTLAPFGSAPGAAGPPRQAGIPFDPPQPAPEVVLTRHDERPFRLSETRGNVVLLYFGFTNCPDACPLTMAVWQRLARLLGGDAAGVRFVMISVDPEWDTPARMRAYVEAFDPRFIGLTGTLAQIEDVSLAFLAPFRKVERALSTPPPHDHAHGQGHGHTATPAVPRYLVSHPEVTYVIDRHGRLSVVFPLGTQADAMAVDVRRLLDADTP